MCGTPAGRGPELRARVASPRQVAEAPHTVGWTRMDSDGEPVPIPRGLLLSLGFRDL